MPSQGRSALRLGPDPAHTRGGGRSLGYLLSPSGLMDKASVSGAEDCGFESHLGWFFYFCMPFFEKEIFLAKKVIPGGTRTPNLLIRSQTPCPIGPQGHVHGTRCGPRREHTGRKNNFKKEVIKGAAGIEPATAGSAILCSTAELYTLDVPAKRNHIRSPPTPCGGRQVCWRREPHQGPVV